MFRLWKLVRTPKSSCAQAALAELVNMIELLCTAEFPAVYTQILTMQQLPTWEYYGYLGL
jgi:hypothetical protein